MCMLELMGVMKSKKDFENLMSWDIEMYFYMYDKIRKMKQEMK